MDPGAAAGAGTLKTTILAYEWLYGCLRVLAALGSFYSVLVMPFELGFFGETPDRFATTDTWVNILLFVDLIARTLIAYAHLPDTEVSFPQFLFRRCRSLRVPSELIACFPWDIVPHKFFTRFLFCFQCVRLICISEVFRYLLERVDEYYRPFFRMARFVFWGVYWSHVVGCIFFFLARVAPDEKDTWIWTSHEDFRSVEHVFPLYVTSLYFATATVTTVGYGDLSPKSNMEKIVFVVIMYITAAITAKEGGMYKNPPAPPPAAAAPPPPPPPPAPRTPPHPLPLSLPPQLTPSPRSASSSTLFGSAASSFASPRSGSSSGSFGSPLLLPPRLDDQPPPPPRSDQLPPSPRPAQPPPPPRSDQLPPSPRPAQPPPPPRSDQTPPPPRSDQPPRPPRSDQPPPPRPTPHRRGVQHVDCRGGSTSGKPIWK